MPIEEFDKYIEQKKIEKIENVKKKKDLDFLMNKKLKKKN
jgi:hypothetical protein